jgi:hypothetical protein
MGKKKPRTGPDVKLHVGVGLDSSQWHLGTLVAFGHNAYFVLAASSEWPDPPKFSYHASGQRHLKMGSAIIRTIGDLSAMEVLAPPDKLVRPELIAAGTILKGTLSLQPRYGQGAAPVAPDLLLDAEGRGFSHDAPMFLRVYWAPCGRPAAPPACQDPGPFVRVLIPPADPLPAIAVCIFQQAAPPTALMAVPE